MLAHGTQKVESLPRQHEITRTRFQMHPPRSPLEIHHTCQAPYCYATHVLPSTSPGTRSPSASMPRGGELTLPQSGLRSGHIPSDLLFVIHSLIFGDLEIHSLIFCGSGWHHLLGMPSTSVFIFPAGSVCNRSLLH